MTRPPYLNHGREHAPGKSDPIPGLAGFPVTWIMGNDIVIHVPSSPTSATHYDFTASNWYTNDNSVFDVVAGTGVTINGPGFYVATIQCEWSATDDTTKAAEMTWNISGFGNQLDDACGFLPSFMGGQAITKATQGFALDPPTSGADLILKQNSGSTASVSMHFAVARLTDDNGNY